MRSRNIKPGFFKNEILGVSDPILSIVFAGLWCVADRDGRLEDRPLRLKAEILPYRENIDFNGYLTELERLDFIHRYKVDGVSFIEVINFKLHQNPHKTEKESTIPKYTKETGSCTLTVKDTLNYVDKTEAARLIPDSLIPDSLIPDCEITDKKPLPQKIENKKFDEIAFRPEFIPQELWLSFLKNRKFKKLENSELALKTACNQFHEAIKNGHKIDDCIGAYVESKWTRFKAEWMNNQQKSGNGAQTDEWGRKV